MLSGAEILNGTTFGGGHAYGWQRSSASVRVRPYIQHINGDMLNTLKPTAACQKCNSEHQHLAGCIRRRGGGVCLEEAVWCQSSRSWRFKLSPRPTDRPSHTFIYLHCDWNSLAWRFLVTYIVPRYHGKNNASIEYWFYESRAIGRKQTVILHCAISRSTTLVRQKKNMNTTTHIYTHG